MEDKATFAGGCFWCTEAIFKRVKGVSSVEPGYAGEGKPNPSYEEVSTGETLFAEAIQIVFDPSVVGYQKLLEIFFKTHDPTSLDRQGADTGPQYRSIVFYHTEEQQKTALQLIKSLDESHIFPSNIVTKVAPLTNFYAAEKYHKDFYDKNKDYPYCTVVINPKLEKFYKEFSPLAKPN